MQPFAIGQLVIIHLPDPSHQGAVIPVSGVVLVPGAEVTVIRIRDLSAHTAEIEVDNMLLSTR